MKERDLYKLAQHGTAGIAYHVEIPVEAVFLQRAKNCSKNVMQHGWSVSVQSMVNCKKVTRAQAKEGNAKFTLWVDDML